jgi:ribose-phosphate pyrophosphokinase
MIFLNDTPIETTEFPNGEIGIVISPWSVSRGYDEIHMKWEGDTDLIKLKFVVDRLRGRAGVSNVPIRLVCPYFPYSRMDRVKGGWAFTLKSVCEFINDLKFDLVTIYEPHSDVVVGLLDRVHVEYPAIRFLERLLTESIFFDLKYDYLVFPDAGAQKRYQGLLPSKYRNILVGHKHRDFDTGQILSFKIVGECNQIGDRAIIIDDLCSYGGTFAATAEALLKFDPMLKGGIRLIVAHCEESIFEGSLLGIDSPIDRVYTTDSMFGSDIGENRMASTDRLEVYKFNS